MTRFLCFLIALVPQLLDQYERPIPRTKPRTELQRAMRRNVAARYDAAQTHTDNQNHWANTDSLSAAAAHSPDVRQKLRDRARYEVANNSYASGMVRTLANDTIGTRPTLQVLSGDDAADTAVERAFAVWARASGFAGKLRTMKMARCVDGETFGLFFTNMALPGPVKLDLRLYEAEQVARPSISLTDPTMSDGIIFDDFGNPTAYTLLRQHPGDTGRLFGLGTEFDTIPARDFLHLFRAERPGQVRGVPEITPAIPLFAQLRRFTLSVIAAAETAADFAGLITSKSPSEDPDTVVPLDLIDIERRMLMTMPEGWGLEQLKAEQPATTYEMFKREIIAEIARCLNMPFNVAAGTSAKMNYSSGRLDHQLYFKSIRVDRSFLEQSALEPTLERWWQEAAMAGVIPESLRGLNAIPPHQWAWDGNEFIDPQKEANGEATRLASHTTTLARQYARQGLDWEDELRQRAKELNLMAELGIPVAQAAPAPANDDEPEDDDE